MYGFYSKNDPDKEIIFKIDSKNEYIALQHFSFLKQISEDQFKQLYEIIKT
jgi:hypothetical protein